MTETRSEAYSRGKADAKRLRPNPQEMRMAKYMARANFTSIDRAYWLGVLREGRK